MKLTIKSRLTHKSTKKHILAILVLIGIASSAYPGLCKVSPLPLILFCSGPFILYGLIYLLLKHENILAGCILAITITLPITMLSQYTMYTNCTANTHGYSALPYLFVTIGNYLIAGLAFFIALNSFFRNHANKRLNSVASFFSALGIIIMVTFLVVALIEISA